MASAKSAQDRVGLFSEPSYVTKGDLYKTGPISELKQFDHNPELLAGTQLRSYNSNAYKKKQMLTTSTKSKTTASFDGYFDKKSKRLYEGEALTDHFKERKKAQLKSKAKNVGGPYVVPSPVKKLAGAGSSMGTFHGKHDHLDPREKPKKPRKPVLRNFTTQPAKKGSGYATPGLTLGKLPEYKPSKYNQALVDERKEAAGNKKKMVVQKAFILTNPNESRAFTKNPYINNKALPPQKKEKAAKKLETPFYAPKLPQTMASVSHF